MGLLRALLFLFLLFFLRPGAKAVVSEPGPGLPQFMVSGHLDDQIFAYYDSERRIGVPRAAWMEEMVEMDTDYWDWLNRNARNSEQILKWRLGVVMRQYNHSDGLHTMQWIFGCSLDKDSLKGGSNQFAYDGREVLSFRKETLTWTACDAVGEDYKKKWESEPGRCQRSKFYLEEKCISMLQKLLKAGKTSVERRVAPVVKVIAKAGLEGLGILICHIRGFYPKELDATWRKDGVVLEHETFWGNVVPNSDGTYYTWLSIEIDLKDTDTYQCHVEHDSLPESPDSDPDLASDDPSSGISPVIIVASTLGPVLAVAFVIGFVLKKRGNRAAPVTKGEMSEPNPARRRRHIESRQTEDGFSSLLSIPTSGQL